MAITNYTNLKSSIADFLNRDDLTDVIPTFIALAEAQISRDLRHWKQDVYVTTTINEAAEYLPDGFLEAKRVWIDGKKALSYITHEKWVDMVADDATAGTPRYYTFNAREIYFYPQVDSDTTLHMTYKARIPTLSDDIDDNWLLHDFPDIYLYGALLHSAPYLQDDPRLAVWDKMYKEAIMAANTTSQIADSSGSTLVMR
jgi:hypothetical protein